ncbi:hypothetical protein LJR234_000934 [Mesorhizobium amorphae]
MVSLAIILPVLLTENRGMAVAVVMIGIAAPLANSIAHGRRAFRHV